MEDSSGCKLLDSGTPSRPAIVIPPIPKPNPLLFFLDDKKRPSLAHESGLGAPCTRCKDACPGLDLHYWRKVCKACKCPKDDHDLKSMDEQDPGKLRIGRLFDILPVNCDSADKKVEKSSKNVHDSKHTEKIAFDWVPPNVSRSVVEEFMAQLPEQLRPLPLSHGARTRRLTLQKQLPLHDFDPSCCQRGLNEHEQHCMIKFVEFFKRESLGQGLVVQIQETQLSTIVNNDINLPDIVTNESSKNCRHCSKSMQRGEIGVFATRAPKYCWHPGCFVCSKCNEVLADLIYFYKKDEIFCGRHFSDSYFPRCAGCDELIFAKEYTQAEGKPWHIEHFCCFSCDTHLGGQRYMYKANQPYCLTCYEKIFARTCEFCRNKISADVQRISTDNHHWHATSQCFFCCGCKKSLLDQRYIFKSGKIFCSVKCKNEIVVS